MHIFKNRLRQTISAVLVLSTWILLSVATSSSAQAQNPGANCPTAGSAQSGHTCVAIPNTISVGSLTITAGNKWVPNNLVTQVNAAIAASAGGGGGAAANTGQLDILSEAAETLPGSPRDLTADNASMLFGGWIARMLNIILIVAVLIVFLFLIWGGFEWITSGGDKGKLESARNRITQAVIGLIVLAASTAILILVQDFLNICVIQIGTSCTNWMQ
jgi:hypothetical protein